MHNREPDCCGPCRGRCRGFTPRPLLGLVVIAVGVIFTLDNFTRFDAEDALRFWPVLLVAAGVIRLLRRPRRGGRTGSFMLIVVGSWLLLHELRWVAWGWDEIWPLLLVIFGGLLIWEAFFRPDRKAVPTETDSTFDTLAVWSGIERKLSSADFRSGEAFAVMGGVTIDLRASLIAGGEAEIFAFAWWGGVEILVPEDWSVTNKGVAFMGGFEDLTRPPRGGSEQRLLVRGAAVMGAVEIRNHKESES